MYFQTLDAFKGAFNFNRISKNISLNKIEKKSIFQPTSNYATV
jgi:hypothetical protein